MTPTRRRYAMTAALLALVMLAYWPGLYGGFIFDDYPNILKQPAVHATALDWEQFKLAALSFPAGVGRPLPMASFALDHVYWGLDPFGYKLSGLLVHALNALLVFQLLRLLFRQAAAQSGSIDVAAFIVALLWALHPLQVSTVLYVVQRMETMSLTFVLLALIAYWQGRVRQMRGDLAWPWLACCIPLVGIGFSNKETAALFPAYTLAMELTLLRFSAISPTTTRNWRIAYGLGIASGTIMLVLLYQHYGSADVYAIREYGAVERMLTQLRIVPMYLGWILLPQPSSYLFYYDNFQHSSSLLQPFSTLLGAAFLVAMLTAAWLAKARNPLFSLGVLWFLASHAITSSFLPLELVFEHRNYFSILGVLVAVFALVRKFPFRSVPQLQGVAVVAVVLGFVALTAIRSANWGNATQLAMELAERNPGSSRASVDLGEQYMILAGNDSTSKYYLMAEAEFERGSRVANSSPMPEQGLVVLAASAGQPAKPEWWDRIEHKLTVRAVGPQEATMIASLLTLRNDGLAIDDQRLADAYAIVASRMRMPAVQYYAFGLHALEKAGDPQLARQLFELTVDNAGSDVGLVQAIADDLVGKGHVAEAASMAQYARTAAGMGITVRHAPAG